MPVRELSPNLALNQLVAERQAAGEPIVHLGFGEARLPVFPALAERLAAGAEHNGYGPVAGRDHVLRAVAGYFTRRGLPTELGEVVTAPGSKPLLMALQAVVPGDVLLPRPCWNTYAPQARLVGKTPLPVPIPAEYGGMPDPELLPSAVRAARAAGHDPRIVVLTLPDNPTGTLAPPSAVRELCAVAEQEDLLIVSDEIYRDVVHDPAATPFLSPAEVVPGRTVVTTGLSKSLALGGWRIGAARFPADDRGLRMRADVAAYASEAWSALSGPMQEVAAYAYAEPPELRAHWSTSARLHGAVAGAVHRIAVAAGASCRLPTGGFYVYPDFAPMRAALASRGVVDSASLQRRLFDDHGVAVLAGHLLGDDPAALRFKAATSVLYGTTREQQWAALNAEDPLRLPHIADALGRIAESLTALTDHA